MAATPNLFSPQVPLALVLQAAAESKQEALQEHLIQQLHRKRHQLLLSSCLAAWRCSHHGTCRHLQQQYLLRLTLQGWYHSASSTR